MEKRGFNVWPSEANFVVIKCPIDQARFIFEALKLRNILIKCLDGSHPRLKDTLRITVGSSEEVDALLSAIDQLVAELGLLPTRIIRSTDWPSRSRLTDTSVPGSKSAT